MTLQEQYKKEGYVVARKIIPDLSKAYNHAVMKQLFNFSLEKYIGKITVSARGVAVYTLFFCDPVMEVLGKITGINDQNAVIYPPVLHILSHSLRIPDGYFGTKAHQDWSSMQGSLSAVTVWIPITETKDNFPLEVIPGSHLRGLLPGRHNGSILEVEVDEKEFIQVSAGPGDVVFLSAFTVHRTGKGTDGLRVAASMRFEDAFEPTFEQRGHPSAQRRVTNYEPITPGFPTVEQVCKIYVD